MADGERAIAAGDAGLTGPASSEAGDGSVAAPAGTASDMGSARMRNELLAERQRRFAETAVLTRLLDDQVRLREKEEKVHAQAVRALEEKIQKLRESSQRAVPVIQQKDTEAELRLIRTELGDNLREQRLRLRTLEKDFQALRRRYERFFTSRSWRITAPLRALKRFMLG